MGAWADGSSWSAVVERLQAGGYNVAAPQFPMNALADNVAPAGEQLVEVGRDANDLLEIVQHEPGGRFRELLDQDVQRRAHALDGHAHRGGDARQHQLGLSDGCER
jgi:hypothetical protein